jgi:serine/threonine protein kinase
MESGQVIAGKYRLNQPIGAGGMASVWSATNTFTERHVAIKFMHSQVSRTPEAARRFLLEAKVSARVNHPNIIDILDVGQSEDGGFFLVMELLQGVSLETAIRRQSPPMLVHEFVGLMIDVARALAAAHRNAVVHRDLKPTNIFLHMIRESVAVPKVLDFGVSKFLEEEQDQALTIAGTVLGSPMYMSPEQASGAAGLDGRTDIFAFGAILFEALCGFRAYDAPNFNALIVAIATRAPRSIHEFAPSMPESLRQLVHDCLVTDRDKRIANFDEVVDRLIAVLPELEASGLRLPVHESARVDPEATSALPLMRQSDRPPSAAPPVGVHLSSPPAYSGGATSPGGLSGDRNAITVSRRPALIFGAGGAVAALLLVGLILFAFRTGSSEPAAAPPSVAASPPLTAPSPRSTTPVTSATPTTSDGIATVVPERARGNDPPVIDIDSLPHVTRPPPPPVQGGMGRISVAATSGWCNVAIDGISRGATPIASLELSAGPHQLTCTSGGKAKNMMVIVPEGATSKVKVSLE